MVIDLDRIESAFSGYVARASPFPFSSAMHRAAVAAVLRAAPEPAILFIRRAEHPRDPWSGHMAFPGGRVDPGDHDALAAAIRETQEEVGLSLRREGRRIGALSKIPAMARGRPVPLVIEPFVFRVEQSSPLVPNEEVQEAVWIPLAFLLDPSQRTTTRRRIAGVPMQMPCYIYETRTVWGLTLRMLDELLQVVRGVGVGARASGT